MLTNRQLILPYAAPYLAYVGIASIPSAYLSTETSYLLRIIVTSLLLLWAWRWYSPLRGPYPPLGSVLLGIGAGLVGVVLWIALLSPFITSAEVKPWTRQGFLLRLVSAGLVVPVFEELMMRGLVFRLALQWGQVKKTPRRDALHVTLDERSINDVAAGQWSWLATIIATVVFASGHAVYEWPAALAFGLFMTLLWVQRKDLVVCITAHAVTNISLALYVFTTGKWQYW